MATLYLAQQTMLFFKDLTRLRLQKHGLLYTPTL